MATYSVNFYDEDPLNVFSQTVGGTATWTGPVEAEGTATITDTETGVEEFTLDDDNAGGETATADVTLGASTSTGSAVDAEETWTVRDSVTGQIFEIATFQVETGGAAGYYTLSEVPLVVGRSYETLAYDSNPDVTSGSPAWDFNDHIDPTGVVDGTGGADSIDSSFTDAEGDSIDDGNGSGPSGNGNVVYAGAGNDSVDAGAGDDYVEAGTGADDVEAGTGDDTVFGQAGNDTLQGEAGDDTLDGGAGDDSLDGGANDDSLIGGTGGDTIDGGSGADTIEGDGGTPTTEVLDWSAQGADGTNVALGFTQNTGDVDVSVSFTDTGNNNPTFLIETSDSIYVEAGEDYDQNSSLRLFGDGDAATSTTTVDFAAASGAAVEDDVQNVAFRISDIDWGTGNHQDVVTVTATDAAGNSVAVTITPTAASNDTVLGDTITAGTVAEDPDDESGSVLIEIAGPVAQIEIGYANDLSGTQAIFVSDIFFETIPDDTVASDVIDGGAGADVIDAQEGDDTITGGSGNDTMTGGYGEDVFVLADGSGADVVTDFDTGDDDSDGAFNDQLDVSGLTDAGGNPVNAWDVVVSDDGSGNALLTFPNGETIVLQGVAPAAVTGAQLLNAAGIPCFTGGTLISTPRGDVPIETLAPGDAVLTMDNGVQAVRWAGRRILGPRELLAYPEHRPICITAGLLGNYAPLFVSPLHGMLLGSEHLGTELLVRAKHLAEAPGPVRVANGKRRVSYHHLLFDAHQIVFANGAPAESFYPGAFALEMYPACEVAKIQAVVPGLRDTPAELCYGPTARPFARRHAVLKSVRLRRSLQPTAIAAE